MLVGENSKEMNFDLGSDKNKSDVLREVAVVSDFPHKSFNLDSNVHALEEEMKKIEAFKRELPLCMQLLKNAIERLKEERRRGKRGAVEELGVLRNYGEGEGRVKASNDFTEKKNWMSSVQLCTPARNQDSVFHLKSYFVEGEGSGNELGCKLRKEGGAFLPFKRASGVMKEKQGTVAVEGLSLGVPEGEMATDDLTRKGEYGNGRAKLQEPQQQEQQKKQRRCWSPELHKIFVHALHQLGGAQTATPKQIRELMKVEGLTNDEVKSHLQKYRIHIKRVDTASSSYSAEQFAFSGSPKGPLHGGKPPKVGSAATAGESIGDEDNLDKSESLGWKSKLHNAL